MRKGGKLRLMANEPEKLTREQKLAAKLRENLRRRKAQLREIEDGGQDESAPPSK